MLNTQVFVDLLLKLAVGMNLVRHDNFLGEVSTQMAFGFLFYNTGSFAVALTLLRVRGIFCCHSGGDP